MKFSGRTPSRALGVRKAPKKSGGALSFAPRQSGARAVLTRLIVAALVLLPLVATARNFLGAGGARLAYESPRAANFAFSLSDTTLQTRPANWLETLFALPLLFIETLRPLADFGWQTPLIYLSLAALLFGALWLGAALFFSRRAPFLPLLLLLSLQLGGAALLMTRYLPPPISLSTPYTTFALARGENLDAALSRLEKAGVGAAALAGNRALSASELSALQKAHPRVLLANGFAAQSDDGARFVAVGLASTRARWKDLNAASREIASRGGTMIFEGNGAREYSRVPLQAIVALPDARALGAWRSQGAKNAVIAAGTSGAAWTLLPRGLRDGKNVVRALRLGKAQPLFARDVAAPSGFTSLVQAFGAAWKTFSRAQRAAALLSLTALFAALWLWSAGAEKRREAPLSGPQRAVGYLRKRRLIVRGGGALVLLTAFFGSALVVFFALNIAPAMLCWLLLDALFFYGYRLWRYAP